MKKIIYLLAIATLTLSSCDVNDPIHETPHPDKGKLIITTDWTNCVVTPASYIARVGAEQATLSGTTAEFPNLLTPGNYTPYLYNTANKISIDGTTATVTTTAGVVEPMPDWFFSGKATANIEADKSHDITVAMKQQVRELTLMIEPTGGTVDLITTITGTLSGVASTLDIDNGTHGSPSNVALTFAKITTGADAGKWSATVRLLGITGTEQKLIGTITFTRGKSPDLSLESDLTTELANFNADKKTPLTLGGTVESPTESGFKATITGWTVRGGTGIAN